METIERKGQVIRFERGVAKIRLEQAAGCASCGSRNSCASAEPAGQVVSMPMSGPASGSIAAGDFVSVSMPAATVTSAALVGYVIPPFGLLLGAIFASFINDSDVATSLGAVLGFVAGLLLTRWLARFAFGQRLTPSVCRRDAPATHVPATPTDSSIHSETLSGR